MDKLLNILVWIIFPEYKVFKIIKRKTNKNSLAYIGALMTFCIWFNLFSGNMFKEQKSTIGKFPKTKTKTINISVNKQTLKLTEKQQRINKFNEWLEKNTSPWDGTIRPFTKLVKSNLGNPDSFKYDEYNEIHYTLNTETNKAIIWMTFRAENGFSAMITSKAITELDMNNKMFVTLKIDNHKIF